MTTKLEGEIAAVVRERGREGLIDVLSAVVDSFGYVPEWAARRIAELMEIPLSRVYGVLTFYPRFRCVSPAKYEVKVCCGQNCVFMGADRVFAALETELEIPGGGITSDRGFGLYRGRCSGMCHRGPVVKTDGDTIAPLEPKTVSKMISSLKKRK